MQWLCSPTANALHALHAITPTARTHTHRYTHTHKRVGARRQHLAVRDMALDGAAGGKCPASSIPASMQALGTEGTLCLETVTEDRGPHCYVCGDPVAPQDRALAPCCMNAVTLSMEAYVWHLHCYNSAMSGAGETQHMNGNGLHTLRCPLYNCPFRTEAPPPTPALALTGVGVAATGVFMSNPGDPLGRRGAAQAAAAADLTPAQRLQFG